MEYIVIHSDRKTIGITIKNGEIIVKAPKRTSEKTIAKVVAKHNEWITKAIEKDRLKRERFPEPSEEQVKELKKAAKNTSILPASTIQK